MKPILPPLADEPVVSVLTTSYNHRRWVQDTINSVANQTYPHIQHVIIENGSTDGSQQFLKSVATKQSITYLSDNIGQANAVNRAFHSSDGQIIGWLNSDDVYFSPTVVARVVRVFRSNPDIAAVYGHAVLIGSDGLVLQTLWVPPHTRLARRLLPIGVVASTMFVRREAVGPEFVDPTFDIAMDQELYLRLARSHRLRRLGSILSGDRHHRLRKSLTLTARMLREDALLVTAGYYGPRRTLFGNRTWRLIYRAMGLMLVHKAASDDLAFSGRRDGIWPLVRRQLVTRRKDMFEDPADIGGPDAADGEPA